MSLTRSRAATAQGYAAVPDDVLAHILPLAGKQEGRSITAVCKRWHGLFYSAPSLWRTFVLAPASRAFPASQHGASERESWEEWFAVQHGILGRVSNLVEVFVAGGSQQECERLQLASMYCQRRRWQLADFLALLTPGVLLEAVLWWEAGMADLQALHRFAPHLEGLLLHNAYRLPTQASATLRALPQLRSLELHTGGVQQAEWGALLQLQQLTRLVLAPHVVLLADVKGGSSVSLTQLTYLSQLRQLTIAHRRTIYAIEAEELYHQQSGTLVVPPPASFPALEGFELSLQNDEWYDWRFSMGGAQFVTCRYRQAPSEDLLPGWHNQLLLFGVCQMGSLQQLLQAAQPPTAGRPLYILQLMRVAGGVMRAEALQGCTALRHLESLVLHICPIDDAALAALLQQTPQLRELVLDRCFEGQLPPCVANRRGLWKLRLTENGLDNLPDGPYLQDLEWLDLGRNKFASLPQALAGASQLLRLELDFMPELALTQADVALLAGLPKLRVLVIGLVSTPDAVWDEVVERMPLVGVYEHRGLIQR